MRNLHECVREVGLYTDEVRDKISPVAARERRAKRKNWNGDFAVVAEWQTRTFEGRVGQPVEVRVFSTAPYGSVAQLVEQRTENPRVGGSIPSRATTLEKTSC
jgi:hypothetical protein